MTPIKFDSAATTTAVVNPTPASVALPTLKNGGAAKWVKITTDALCGYRPILTGETPALATLDRVVPECPLVVYVGGFDAIRLDKPVAGTANVTIAALES